MLYSANVKQFLAFGLLASLYVGALELSTITEVDNNIAQTVNRNVPAFQSQSSSNNSQTTVAVDRKNQEETKEPVAEQTKTSSVNDKKANTANEPNTASDIQTVDHFDPSEDISEDLAVSFPTDI